MRPCRLATLTVGVALVLTAACGEAAWEPEAVAPEPPPLVAPEDLPEVQLEAIGATEWLSLGRDLGNSRAAIDETFVGPDNVGALLPSWEVSGINGVTGTPVVADGVVYFGDWTGHVRAIDAVTGEELWSVDLSPPTFVYGAVAVDDSRVFVGTFPAEVVALDRETGERLWGTDVGQQPGTWIFGSPIHADGLVLVGTGSDEVQTGGESFRGHLTALDAETGDEAWTYFTVDEGETAGVPMWTAVAVDSERNHAYFGTGPAYLEPPSDRGNSVIAVDLTTGDEVWVHQFTEGDVFTFVLHLGPDADVSTPPNLFQVDGVDAVGAGDKAGVYKAIDRDTGEELWSTQLTEGGLQGGVMAGAAVDESSIYVASHKGATTADLLALDQDTGDVRWQTDVEGQVYGPVTWANGVVYVAEMGGRILGYDADSGELLWGYQSDAAAAGGIAVAGGTVYAGWGWWSPGAPPEDPQGGLIAFRLGDETVGELPAAGSSGEAVFQRSCSFCHPPTQPPDAASFIPSMVGVGDRLTEEQIREVVLQGRAEMPSWEGSLSPEAIDAVVEYVQGLEG